MLLKFLWSASAVNWIGQEWKRSTKNYLLILELIVILWQKQEPITLLMK